MKLFIISYGLDGGFGGANNYEVIQTVDLEAAEDWAHESACETYEQYAGMYGLRDEQQIMTEEDCDEEEARIVFEEERETWLVYTAVPYSKEVEKIAERHNYHNEYTEITNKM